MSFWAAPAGTYELIDWAFTVTWVYLFILVARGWWYEPRIWVRVIEPAGLVAAACAASMLGW